MTSEELFKWCCKQDCKDGRFSDCDLCMYEKGRADRGDELNSVLHDLYVKCKGNYQEFYNAIKEQLKEQK